MNGVLSKIPQRLQHLLRDETRAFAFLATTMADGSPQVTPVWFDVADGRIRINTAEGRVKWRNMQARKRVALTIFDPDDPYRYLQVRGEVEAWTTQGAREHINRLAGKYHGQASYDGPADEARVIFTIRPRAVSPMA
jgi:PPOX class probable F420-dependent enzyme